MLSKDFWVNEENKVIKQGKDCLKQHLGEIDTQQFLDIYYLRRYQDSKGKDYTKWRQDNPPEEDPMMQKLLHEMDWEETKIFATA
jgi:hypothetical protein